MRTCPSLACRLVALALAAAFAPAVALAEVGAVVVLPVGYQVVGDATSAPEKARVVAKQVEEAVIEAGGAVVPPTAELRPCGDTACVQAAASPRAQAVAVNVAESGALYEFRVLLANGGTHAGQYTGPFASALQEIRALVRRSLVDAQRPAAPVGPPAPPETPPAAAPSTPPAPAPAEEPPPAWLYPGAIVLTAAGGAAIIAGAVLMFVDDPCWGEEDGDCKTRLDTSIVGLPFLGVGALAAAVGVAGLVLLDDDEGPSTTDNTPAISVGFAPRPFGWTAGLAAEF